LIFHNDFSHVIYHERCAEWLFNTGFKVSVVNPAYIKYYGQSLGVRSKNDKKDSLVLARYGLTKKSIAWEPETPEIRILKALASGLTITIAPDAESGVGASKNGYQLKTGQNSRPGPPKR
jgi:hypothetical protein